MPMSRQEVTALLMRVGLPDLAAEAKAELPDPVETEVVVRFGERHGVTRDWLINHMGGSP